MRVPCELWRQADQLRLSYGSEDTPRSQYPSGAELIRSFQKLLYVGPDVTVLIEVDMYYDLSASLHMVLDTVRTAQWNLPEHYGQNRVPSNSREIAQRWIDLLDLPV